MQEKLENIFFSRVGLNFGRYFDAFLSIMYVFLTIIVN